MNPYINAQIKNMLQMLDSFEAGCRLAAVQDDQIVDKSEEKLLKRLHSATEKYRDELKRL